MTKKRFTMYQNTIYDDGHIINAFECMKLLNWFDRKNDELFKENEQLRQQIKDMKIRFKRKYDHEFDEIVDELW